MAPKRALSALAGAAFLALLIAGVTGCGGGSTTPTNGDSHVFTSTSVNSHTHTVTIDKIVVTTPPAAGIDETTSSNSGHTHSFAMTQAELTTVNGGTAVTVTTGNSDVGGAHTHQFTVSKWF